MHYEQISVYCHQTVGWNFVPFNFISCYTYDSHTSRHDAIAMLVLCRLGRQIPLDHAIISITGGQGQKSERGVQFPFQRGGGVNFSFQGGINPPSTQKIFRLRHLLLFKVVRPPVINLRCGSYSLALHLQIIL